MYDKAYIKYLAYFHGSRDYFECHEVLEERWRRELPLKRDSILVAFIQLAVALYHHRRGNFIGAKRILKKGKKKFVQHKSQVNSFGLDTVSFFVMLDDLERRINQHLPYIDVDLPIYEPTIITLVKKECNKMGTVFPSKSNLKDTRIINKHLYR